MIKTYIIGKKSYLSQNLIKKLSNVRVISSQEIDDHNLFKNSFKEKKFNLVINLFFPSSKLSDLKTYQIFYDMCFMKIAKIFDNIKSKKIQKIIYSSSSSIYGSLEKEIITKDPFNRKLYSSCKIAVEILIQNYCLRNNINFVNARIFNMYGHGDNFSIISKLIKSAKENKKITVNNGGESSRDFINVEDVSIIYKKLLFNNFIGSIDIGSGFGIKLKNLIKYIGERNLNLNYKNTFINEEQTVIADTENLSRIINLKKLKKIENFLKRCKIKSSNNIDLIKNKSNPYNILENKLPGTVIYGAGFAGKKLAESLKDELNTSVYCFIDDDKKKINKTYKDKKIISFEKLKSLSKKYLISNIIIAIPSLSNIMKEKIISKLLPLSLNVSTLPDKNQIVKNNINIDDVKKIDLTDIFDRKIFKVNNKSLRNFKDNSVLITGGAGSIGSELANQLSKLKPKKIILLDHDETALFNIGRQINNKSVVVTLLGNITDQNFVRKTIKKYKVNHIFHAAAYKHVVMLENNIAKAVENNIFGTISILNGINNSVKSVTIISTDKAAKPKNVLGITKRISEIVSENYFRKIKLKNTKLSIVRFGNVFASQGSAIQLFCEQIKNGGPVTVTDFKATRYFMSINEACNLVLQSSQLDKKNSTYILKMGKSIKIIDIVRKLIDLFGYKNNKIKIIETGLQKGEKLNEKLSISKKFYSTNHEDIFLTKEMKYSKNSIELLINDLKNIIEKFNEQDLLKRMRDFLKMEI